MCRHTRVHAQLWSFLCQPLGHRAWPLPQAQKRNDAWQSQRHHEVAKTVESTSIGGELRTSILKQVGQLRPRALPSYLARQRLGHFGISEKPSRPHRQPSFLVFFSATTRHQPTTNNLRPPFPMDRLRPLILFEAIVVVGMWTSAILVPIRLINQAHQTMTDVMLDPSVELKILAWVLLMALELYERRMLDNFLRGISFRQAKPPWNHTFPVVWCLRVALKLRAPAGDGRWIRRQAIIKALSGVFSYHSLGPPELKTLEATLPAYMYKKLSGPRSIRLITLEVPPDGTTTAPISCSMQEVPLDSAPPFVALSYAWDSQEGAQEIACEGARLAVTKNCV